MIRVKAARPGRRVAAFGWDYLLLIGYAGVLFVVANFIGRYTDVRAVDRAARPWVFDGVAFVTLVLPTVLYFAFSECGPQGATWGKRRVGLRVVATTGEAATLRASLTRSAIKFLPWQIAHSSLFHILNWPFAAEIPPGAALGLAASFILVGLNVWGLVSPARRTIYDVIAGTRVVAAEESS